MCTVIFLIQSMLYNGIVIYAPALALEEVAGLGIIIYRKSILGKTQGAAKSDFLTARVYEAKV